MGRFEIRTDSGTRPVEGLEELRRLARVGALRPEHEVREGPGPWRRADALAELRGCFNLDVWGAWEDEDEDDAPTPQGQARPQPAAKAPPPAVKAVSPEPPAAPPAAPPVSPPPPGPPRPATPRVSPPPGPPAPPAPPPPSASAPRPEPPRPAPPEPSVHTVGRLPGRPAPAEPPELPPSALHPVEEPRVVDLPATALQPLPEGPRGSRGLVIAFPGERGRRPAPGALAHAEAEPLPLLAQRPRVPPPEPPSLLRGPGRFALYGGIIAVFAVCTALAVSVVRSQASWTSPRPAALEGAAATAEPAGPPVVRRPELGAAADAGDLDALLNDLREQISMQSVEPDADGEALADAMFIDLRRLISVRDTHVQVLRVTETRRPLPELVEVRVWVDTQGDVVRELAAAGLVVGKYLYQLGLDATVVEVILVGEDGSTRKRGLRGEAAASLFQGRLGLREFLLDAPPEGAPTAPPAAVPGPPDPAAPR